jgi:hypothetical protein
MKTIDQLLKLSQNPFYKLLPEEQEVLDNFLLKKQEKGSENSQKENSEKLSESTPVTVRNVVEKADTGLPIDSRFRTTKSAE